jgi:hypothetical protein
MAVMTLNLRNLTAMGLAGCKYATRRIFQLWPTANWTLVIALVGLVLSFVTAYHQFWRADALIAKFAIEKVRELGGDTLSARIIFVNDGPRAIPIDRIFLIQMWGPDMPALETISSSEIEPFVLAYDSNPRDFDKGVRFLGGTKQAWVSVHATASMIEDGQAISASGVLIKPDSAAAYLATFQPPAVDVGKVRNLFQSLAIQYFTSKRKSVVKYGGGWLVQASSGPTITSRGTAGIIELLPVAKPCSVFPLSAEDRRSTLCK